ncbi:MAG TPA: hypothetical protein VFS00_11150 [Polyangiaceae bacterium]|nr:hypothetical protein [Polyangiaceae bacterium]
MPAPPTTVVGPPPRAAVTAEARAGAEGGQAPSVAGTTGTPALEMPPDAGCKLKAPSWDYTEAALRFRAGAPPYAEVSGFAFDVEAALPVGRAELGAMVEMMVGDVRLRGNVAAEKVPLYPAKPTVVAGVLVPGSDARLRWEATERGAVSVRLPPNRRLRLDERARRQSWPCERVAMAAGSFAEADAEKLLPHAQMGSAELRAGAKAVPISATPGGPVRATVTVGLGDEYDLMVGPTRGKSTLVRWWLRDDEGGSMLVSGWAPSALVGIAPSDGARAWGTGSGRGVKIVACRGGPAELVAEVGGERRAVGEVVNMTSIVVEPGGGDGEMVALRSAGRGPGESGEAAVRPAPGARLLMRRVDVERCRQP